MSALELDNAHCLASLLSRLGALIPGQRLHELAQGHVSTAFITRTLRARGEAVRPVEVRAHDLRQLELPTLLSLRTGKLCILTRVRGRRAHIECDGSARELDLQMLAAEVVTAFERSPRVDATGSLLRMIAGVLGQRTLPLLWFLAVGLGLLGLSLLAPVLTRRVMGDALAEQAPSLLDTIVSALVAVACMRAFSCWLRARARLSIEVDLVCALSRTMFQRLHRLPFLEHQQRGIGELLQAMGSSEALARAVVTLGIGPVLDALLALAYLLVVAASSARVAVALGALAVVATVGTVLLGRRHAFLQGEEIRESARSRARLHELVQGIATLKSEHAESAGMQRWLEVLLAERGVALSKELTACWLFVWLSVVERVGRLGVLGWAAFEVIELRMTVAELLYLGMMGEGFVLAATSLCRAGVALVSARRHLARVDELLAIEPVPARSSELASRAPALEQGIELSDVWFRYGPDQPWVLKGYNLSVAPGEHFTLRGSSGAGKSTILRLIAGLYRPERGTVSVLGRDPWHDRSAVTYLPQHAQLLSGSLRDNLVQLSGKGPTEVGAACEQTGLAEWLRSLPMGIETALAPSGANLSGGQRQWVVLTAAVAAQRAVVLMDESSSQLDAVSRAQLSVRTLFAGKITVTVTHDE